MRLFALIVIVCLLLAPLQAQEPEAFELMPEGAYGTTVQGGLTPGESKAYYFMALAGQQLKARLVTLKDNGFLRIADNNDVDMLAHFPPNVRIRKLDLVLPRKGRYTIEVCAGATDCAYLLEVTLDDPAPVKPKKPKKLRAPARPAPSPAAPEERP